jgi:hypothetical protein
MDIGKARMLVETKCYIALLNVIYGNLPFEVTTLDCIAAKRRLPCSLCLLRSTSAAFNFPSSPQPSDMPTLAPFKAPINTVTSLQTKPLLNKKELAHLEAELVKFGEVVRIAESAKDIHGYRPRSSYFPIPIINTILDNILGFSTEQEIKDSIPGWIFVDSYHTTALFALILRITTKISSDRDAARSQRNAKARATALAKRVAAQATLIDQTSPSDVEVVDPDPPAPVPHPLKRPALNTITNQPAKRVTRRSAPVPLASVSEVSASFRPAYQTRTTRTRIRGIGEENVPVVEPRRSGRFLK